MSRLASLFAAISLWIARHWLQLAVVLGALAILTDTFLVQGVFLPVRIVGASMAEKLCGDHLELNCPHCQRIFKIDAAGPGPRDETAICPWCYATEPLANARRMPGDRVLIDRVTSDLSGYRRFEIVAARQPGNEKRLVVKRIVGLPGEKIGIREGRLFVDGKPYVKSAEEQSAVFVESGSLPATDSLGYNQFRRGLTHSVPNVRAIPSSQDGNSQARFFRDLYYLDPGSGTADWEMPQPLGSDEYFLLGDNPPASIDSRHWPSQVRREDIVGRVIGP